MHALIVVAHPDPKSLSHGVAAQLAEGVTLAGHTFEIADIAREGFDPRYTATDLAVHRREVAPAADVAAEQARIDGADTLVLVYPVYWWSMPALLKGWIDRVFANGWAYDEGAGIKPVKRLRHLKVHLVAIGGATTRTYARHGYFGAMKTQIDHGIFDYVGAPVATSELLLDTEAQGPAEHLEAARAIGRNLFEATRHNQNEAA
ncbi:NAD(P)H-dependent oxidoreductase [Aminobacter anthyllidis]|uniref:NAD(P)H-dependent oxidoreductase n=1 Tax=Aminobacter anthyllidis TaxID=1035067 RepID=UPI002458406F|nr:NAD(P)H-dependent oxidoreductase [Aminobacter anthyllidis]MDH4985700.1 NAD(P)H-dependent oxidoreductase [Aminobacter anthyllidis]